MANIENLQEAIGQYEEQLAQVETTLSKTAKGPDRDNLLSLQSDIQELISLTKESLESLKESESNENTDNQSDDPLAREYALFKAELEGDSDESAKNVSQDSTNLEDASNDIQEELKALEGTKCRAPHGSSWGGTGYHNAMVWSAYTDKEEPITSMQDIKVRIFFLNPTHKEMIPCPYFLEGSCKFSDEQCHYSHGEGVALSSLQEYREPDFSSIKMGSRVLAKQKNQLWHRCVVLKTPEKEGEDYRVKFESSGKITEVGLQDLLPLNDADLELSDSSDSDNNDDEATSEEFQSRDQLLNKSLLSFTSGEPLGRWEQHTRGIGSKLMAQMGYVHGTGLGKRADGRVEPVQATVLPAGKSLDHCMELRENAGGDKDLFSVERKMRKQQLKMEQQREKQYQREKQREKSNVFNFINATLGDKPAEASSSSKSVNFKTESNRKLNIASLQIGENIARLEKETEKLKNSITTYPKGSIPYNNIVMQYNDKQKELLDLRASERSINDEQKQRRSKAKLSIF